MAVRYHQSGHLGSSKAASEQKPGTTYDQLPNSVRLHFSTGFCAVTLRLGDTGYLTSALGAKLARAFQFILRSNLPSFIVVLRIMGAGDFPAAWRRVDVDEVALQDLGFRLRCSSSEAASLDDLSRIIQSFPSPILGVVHGTVDWTTMVLLSECQRTIAHIQARFAMRPAELVSVSSYFPYLSSVRDLGRVQRKTLLTARDVEGCGLITDVVVNEQLSLQAEMQVVARYLMHFLESFAVADLMTHARLLGRREQRFTAFLEEEQALPTSIIVRVVPRHVDRNSLLRLVEDCGFQGTYDFLYIPSAGKPHTPWIGSIGYALINFPKPEHLIAFVAVFTQRSEEPRQAYPAKCQGLPRLLQHYQRSPAVHITRLPYIRYTSSLNLSE